MALQQELQLHKHAFWLYGVIVGLAIKDALEAVTPHLINVPLGSKFGLLPDLARLLVFLILIVRFYFGSALFFGSAYESPNARFSNKNYAMDFLFGFMHFLVFFLLAFSIDIHTQPPMLFRSLLVIILLFDTLWFVFCRKYDTRDLMVWWMVLNLATLVLSVLVYLITDRTTSDSILAELLAFIPIILASALDFGELVTSKPIIADWVANLLFRRRGPETPEQNS
jgi:hypothetical protein